jgi:hypothetical protein
MEVTNIVFAWSMLIRVHEAQVSRLTIAARADVDHVVYIAFNMVMNVATQLNVRVARLFKCGGFWDASSTQSTRERSSHRRVGSKDATEAASQSGLNGFSRGDA